MTHTKPTLSSKDHRDRSFPDAVPELQAVIDEMEKALQAPRFRYVREALLRPVANGFIGLETGAQISTTHFLETIYGQVEGKPIQDQIALALGFKSFSALAGEIIIQDLSQACRAADALAYYPARDAFDKVEKIARALIENPGEANKTLMAYVVAHAHPSHVGEATLSKNKMDIRHGAAIILAFGRVRPLNGARLTLETAAEIQEAADSMKAHPAIAKLINPGHSPKMDNPHRGAKGRGDYLLYPKERTLPIQGSLPSVFFTFGPR